jgi:hypothetical protein
MKVLHNCHQALHTLISNFIFSCSNAKSPKFFATIPKLLNYKLLKCTKSNCVKLDFATLLDWNCGVDIFFSLMIIDIITQNLNHKSLWWQLSEVVQNWLRLHENNIHGMERTIVVFYNFQLHLVKAWMFYPNHHHSFKDFQHLKS